MLHLLLVMAAVRVVASLLLRRRFDLAGGSARTDLTIIQPNVILIMGKVLVLRTQLVNLCLQLQFVLLLGGDLLSLVRAVSDVQ